MPTFTIDKDDNVSVFASDEEAGGQQQGTERFHSEQQFASLAAEWPGRRLVDLWNSLPGVQPVKKFTSHKTAVTRIWKVIQSLDAGGAKLVATSRHKNTSPGQKAGLKRAGDTGRQNTSRQNTKTSQVIALLEQPSGASLQEVMKATGWQAHSVRGFISGHLGKKLGLRVKSFRRDGERVYALRSKAS